MEQTYQVIVVGAGFAGLTAARKLGRKGVRVLLIDANNYHQFQPLLYQVATSQIGVSAIARPIRSVFRRLRSVRVLTAEVAAVDAANRTVTTLEGDTFQAQMLVIAAGRRPELLQHPGRRRACLPAVLGHRRHQARRQAHPTPGPGRPGARRLRGRGGHRRRPYGRGDRRGHDGKRQVRGVQVLLARARRPVPCAPGGHDPERDECLLGEVAGIHQRTPREDRRPAAPGSRRHGGPARRRGARRRGIHSRPGGGLGRAD